MKANEIHALTDNELNNKLTELKQELFNLRFSHATGQLNNPMQMVKCKKAPYTMGIYTSKYTHLTPPKLMVDQQH